MPNRRAGMIIYDEKVLHVADNHAAIHNYDIVTSSVGIDASIETGKFRINHANGHLINANLSFTSNADCLGLCIQVNGMPTYFKAFSWGLSDINNNINLNALLELERGDEVRLAIGCEGDEDRTITIKCAQFTILAI